MLFSILRGAIAGLFSAVASLFSSRRQRGAKSFDTTTPYAIKTDGQMGCVCDFADAPAANMCDRCPMRPATVQHDLDCWAAVMELRWEEAASVCLLSDNADFNSQTDRLVECIGDWTGFEAERFGGKTMLEALQSAVEAKRSRM